MDRRLVATALLTVVLGAGACGGDDDDGAATATTKPSDGGNEAGRACDLVTKAEVESAIGQTISPPADTSKDDALTCAYTTTQDTDQFVLVNLTVRPTAAAEFDATANVSRANAQTTVDVAGVGEKATFFVTSRSGANAYQLLTREGSALAFVTIAGRIDEAKAKQAAIATLQKALSRLES